MARVLCKQGPACTAGRQTRMHFPNPTQPNPAWQYDGMVESAPSSVSASPPASDMSLC